MRTLDVRSIVIAAMIGGLLLWAWGYVIERDKTPGVHRRDLAAGAGLGAAVQIGVRLLGVS